MEVMEEEVEIWESKDWSSSHDDCDGNGINFDDQDDEDVEAIDGASSCSCSIFQQEEEDGK